MFESTFFPLSPFSSLDQELDVSILQSMSNEVGRVRPFPPSPIDNLDLFSSAGQGRIMFRQTEVLSVIESAEPNNILWENLENSFTERFSTWFDLSRLTLLSGH
jgi:hypothetical protein